MSDDAVDPKELLETKCTQSEACRPLLEALQACNERVEARGERNTETCIQELFDLTPCIDNCVAKKLFKKLK